MGLMGLFFLGSEDNENISSIAKKCNCSFEEAKAAYIKMLEELGCKVQEEK
jgi:predicted transcriptional regulator